jgi:hypothetical protein
MRSSLAGVRCDGVTRRELLRVGALTPFGLTLTGALRGRGDDERSPRARAAILIWLDGGPSHLDTFDLKPDAPPEVRGPFQPIATRVPGVAVAEYLPRTATLADQWAIVRSMTSTLGEHNFGSHYLLTGYKPTPVLQYPSFGSVLAHVRGAAGALPSYVAVPEPNDMAGAGYLPGSCRPFAVAGDPNRPDFRVRDLDPYDGVTAARLERRRNFRQALDQFSQYVEQSATADGDFEQAYRLIFSAEAKRAFALDAETAATRDRYGRTRLGQGCLLARRLIEAGVRFVTVTDRGWDTHGNLFNQLKEGFTGGSVGKVPTLDLAYSALLQDLAERGRLDETLVILMGEFGRTPKLNTAAGRDHWPRVFSVVLAGGGVRGGQVIGRSDSRGESPADRPITPEDLARTVYTLLGVDPDREFTTRDGRPVAVNQYGKVVSELLA